ncbi:MAG: ABC transporter permease, partial [Ruminococcus sp.]|nr:ABC transporter permease [Ruminococcus sp.]
MKFRTLFIKELREMLNTQTILAMVVAVVVMGFAGRTMSRAVEESAETMMDINICDNDNTEFTQNMIKFMTNNLAQLGGEVNVIEISSDDYAEELKKADVKNVVLIPEGFTESVEQNKSAQVQYIQQLNSLATFSNLNAGSQVAVEYLSAAVKEVVYSTKVAGGKLTNQEVTFLNDPITLDETTIVAGKSENISSSIVLSLCSAQSNIVPIMLFVLVMMSSNMILNAVSTEKIDKTLETLLSAPVSRLSVIAAKMLAAAVIAAMQASVYMLGARNMMSGVMDNVSADSGYSEILKNLGLTMSAGQYVLVGLQMFLTILIALSVALILGVLAKDAKSAQTLT